MATILGDNTDNSLDGTGRPDIIFGLGGEDDLFGLGDNDILVGGSGADRLNGGADIDAASYINASAGVTADFLFPSVNAGDAAGDEYFEIEILDGSNFDDILGGDDDPDLIAGDDGNDVVAGRGGDDILHGDAGNDRLFGGTGADILVGGIGIDTAEYSQASGVGVDLETGGFAGEAVGDTYFSIEFVVGSSFDDILRGDALANQLFGQDGHDYLYGRGGDDSLFGGSGNDSLYGDAGADTMDGGSGRDTYYVHDTGDLIIEATGGGTADQVYSSVSYQLARDAEVETMTTASAAGTAAINLVGNSFVQTIFGNAGNNIINGLGGIDTMHGRGGNDKYYVDNAADVVIEAIGGGTDRIDTSVNYSLKSGVEVEVLTTTNAAGTDAIKLAGNSLANTVIGNAGDNFLNGAAGADTLRGLGGNDIFMFNAAIGGGNIDDIVDFNVADDTIRLENAIFTTITGTGVLTAAQFVANASGTAQDADDRIIYKTDVGRLIYDANGSTAGARFLVATLDAGLAMTNADFFIV
jgi:Ca2+-binding RTX toxin-like protein